MLFLIFFLTFSHNSCILLPKLMLNILGFSKHEYFYHWNQLQYWHLFVQKNRQHLQMHQKSWPLVHALWSCHGSHLSMTVAPPSLVTTWRGPIWLAEHGCQSTKHQSRQPNTKLKTFMKNSNMRSASEQRTRRALVSLPRPLSPSTARRP